MADSIFDQNSGPAHTRPEKTALLRGQGEMKNTAHFHGYPPPCPRAGGWGGNGYR